MNDADLHKGLSNAASILITRVYAAVPADDPELTDLCDQWVGTFGLALKYAKDKQAAHVANTLLDQLLNALKARGITTI